MRALPSGMTWPGAVLALVGVVWLAPLMLDQLVLFGDRDQVARAAASRAGMVWPALLLGAGAAFLAAARRPVQAAVAGLPLIAVILAWVAPDAALQIVVYALTASISIGAALGATIPIRRRRLPLPAVLAGVGLMAALVILADSILAILAAIGLISWWVTGGDQR